MNRATDDLISRAAALEIVDAVKSAVWSQSGKVLCGKIYSQINAIPVVNATPVIHGRWVKMTGMMPPEYHGHYECSECQWHMKGLRNSWTREEDLNYCPNCGAKMETKND